MIRELGQDGFRRYRASLLRRGHRLHEYVEAKLMGDEGKAKSVEEEAAKDEVSANHIRSVTKRLEELECPVALEAHVMHPTLQYHVSLSC